MTTVGSGCVTVLKIFKAKVTGCHFGCLQLHDNGWFWLCCNILNIEEGKWQVASCTLKFEFSNISWKRKLKREGVPSRVSIEIHENLSHHRYFGDFKYSSSINEHLFSLSQPR